MKKRELAVDDAEPEVLTIEVSTEKTEDKVTRVEGQGIFFCFFFRKIKSVKCGYKVSRRVKSRRLYDPIFSTIGIGSQMAPGEPYQSS